MVVHEKIKFFRQAKNWTQEEVAEKLGLSPNGYGSIERGETDINLSRLEQIAKLFAIKPSQLFDFDEKTVFNLTTGTNNTSHTQNNPTNCSIYACSPESVQLKIDLEKQQLLNAEKDKQIEHLKEIVELLRKNNL